MGRSVGFELPRAHPRPQRSTTCACAGRTSRPHAYGELRMAHDPPQPSVGVPDTKDVQMAIEDRTTPLNRFVARPTMAPIVANWGR
jgi:hypothetical protein